MFDVAQHFGLAPPPPIVDMAEVRTLRDDERLPETLDSGFDRMAVDPNWCWVLERDCGIVVALLAAPFHGVVFLGRLAADERARPADVLLLVRRAIHEIEDRGFSAYLTFLDETEPGRKMTSILKRSGALVFEAKHTCIGGSIAKLGAKLGK